MAKARLILRFYWHEIEEVRHKTFDVEIPDEVKNAGERNGAPVYYSIVGGEWLDEEASNET